MIDSEDSLNEFIVDDEEIEYDKKKKAKTKGPAKKGKKWRRVN